MRRPLFLLCWSGHSSGASFHEHQWGGAPPLVYQPQLRSVPAADFSRSCGARGRHAFQCTCAAARVASHPLRSAEPPPGADHSPPWCCSPCCGWAMRNECLDRRHRPMRHGWNRGRSSWSTAALAAWRSPSPSPRRSRRITSSPARSLSYRPQDANGCRPTFAACFPGGGAALVPGDAGGTASWAGRVLTTKLGDWSTIELGLASMRWAGSQRIVPGPKKPASIPTPGSLVGYRAAGQTHPAAPALAPLDFSARRYRVLGLWACSACLPRVTAGARRCGSAVHERKPASIVA